MHMTRLVRLTNILFQLQAKRVVTSQELARKFGISQRTVYRDIKTLEEAGLPIVGEVGTGYWLSDDYRLPPVMFSEHEITALVTARKYIEGNSDQSLVKDFDKLIIKVKGLLRFAAKEKAEKIEQRTEIFYTGPKTKTNYLSMIQSALVNSVVLRLKYHTLYSDRVTLREIEPLLVYYTRQKWLLIAHCRLRDALREFRIDRIIDLAVTSQNFSDRHFNFDEYIKEMSEKKSNYTDTPLS